MKYMKIQSDLHAKSTLVTCNSLINVVFNNTLANNSNKECLMKVCLEHDPRGCLFICLCTAALMIFLFLPLTASNKKPAFRTFHKLHLFQWCNAGSFPTVEKLKKGELSKKSYELEKKKSVLDKCITQNLQFFLLYLTTQTVPSNTYFTSDSAVAVVSLTICNP